MTRSLRRPVLALAVLLAASLLLACGGGGGSNATPTDSGDPVTDPGTDPVTDPGTWEDLSFTATATVPCSTSDLAVTRLGSRVERSHSQCTVLNWRFTVKNTSSASSSSATVRLEIVDDGLTTQDEVMQLPSLAPNASIQFQGSISTFAGVATVVVTVDPLHALAECDEADNVRSKTVTCNG